MNHRENLVRAMRRQSPDFVPFEFGMVSTLCDKIKEETGAEDPYTPFRRDEAHAQNGIRGVGPKGSEHPRDYSAYYEGRTFAHKVHHDEWGVARQAGTFMHFTHIESPLISASSRADIEAYPEPDIAAAYRWEHVKDAVANHHAAGYPVTGHVGHTFETAWQIRGMQEFLTDMAIHPDWCETLIEKLRRSNLAKIRYLTEGGVDVLRIGDDVGTQNGMMFSPESWRTLFKPVLAEYIALAKQLNPEVLIWYHSDGDIRAILPDLIEVGLDILNPVQPECMDPVELKREYGRDLSFWGTIGTQTVMPFGTPAEVRDTVRRMIDTVGKDGGLCLAPTHVLEPEVPVANIEAFVDAIVEYGRYGVGVG